VAWAGYEFQNYSPIIMDKFSGEQLSLIADDFGEYSPIGDWHWDNLGSTELPDPKLTIVVLGSGNSVDPKTDFKLPIGNLERKPINKQLYWYWRYYNHAGKKRSIYLAKDYNKAIAKVRRLGIPSDVKPASVPDSYPNQSTHRCSEPSSPRASAADYSPPTPLAA
jgi:hypothetical protein